MRELAERLVDAMNAIHGVHPGYRAVHAKGSCCRGTFTGTSEAARLSVASHLQGATVPVTVRFSSGSGRPARADGAKDERGMAVKFQLPDGTTTDIVALTLPVFFVRTPEDFLAFLEAQRPDAITGKPDPERVLAFVADHPETQGALGFFMFTAPPASFAGCTFHGIHAFALVDPEGRRRFVRYRWVPEEPEATLSDEETRALGKNYLHEDLRRRLDAGSVAFQLRLQLAEPEDDSSDPTVPWPEERTWVQGGRLVIDRFEGEACAGMIFDPGRVTAGIEPSGDKILHARSHAYAVSFSRRTS